MVHARLVRILRLVATCSVLLGVVALQVSSAPPAAAEVPMVHLSVTGPVYPGDAPDPDVLVMGPYYYGYSTDNGVDNIALFISTDMTHWHLMGDALPVLPPWAQYGYSWSPTVVAAPGGGYEMFYDALDPAAGVQCIGRATSTSPDGPFVDLSLTPFLCQRSLGGSIDASVYRRRAGDVLVWKSDATSGIWAQQLGPGDASLVGSPVLLLSPTATWEDGVIEGPSLVRVGDTTTLWFSAGRWWGAGYSIGMAVCASALGPCDATTATQELATGNGLTGPGGPSFFSAGGTVMMAFAAWVGLARDPYVARVTMSTG